MIKKGEENMKKNYYITPDFLRREKRLRRKEIMMDIHDFFERIFLLLKFTFLKALQLITIPCFAIGVIGAFYLFKLIYDAINNNVMFINSIYFSQTYKFLGFYLVYLFVKMSLECNLSR